MNKISLGLSIAGVVFFVIDLVIFVACVLYCYRKRQRKVQEELEGDTVPFIHIPSPIHTTVPVEGQIPFELPKEYIKPKKIPMGKIDIFDYGPKAQIKLNKIPRLGYEFFYDFRTTQLKITLKGLKNIPHYLNEQVVVSIRMSHTSIVYHSSKLSCPDSVLSEEFSFPLDSVEISSDPPVTAKFNVWHVDKNSRRNAYGYVEVNVEEALSKTGISASGSNAGRTEWQNIIASDQLTDEGFKGELLLTLSYLSAAQRIGVTIAKAKNLILTACDKDLHAKITLLWRDEEQNSVVTNYFPITQDPEFNQEFIFRFSDFRSMGIDGVAIRIEIIARQIGLLDKPRVLGQCYVGNSGRVDRPGKEHWVVMLTSPKTVTKWHLLKDPYSSNDTF